MFPAIQSLGRIDPCLKFHPRRSCSFTLVELLVVISILMVLTSLVSSSLKKVLGKSVELQCLNNMKTIAGAQSLYAQDYNESWIISSHYGTRGGWTGVLNKPSAMSNSSSSSSHALGYITDVRSMYCPRAPEYPQFTSRPSSFNTYGSMSRYYQYPSMKYRLDSDYFLLLPVNFSQRPDKMAPILDTTSPYIDDGSGYYGNLGSNISLRHSGASSSVFLDGHAKSVTLDEFQLGEVLLQNMNHNFFDSRASMDNYYSYNRTSYTGAYTEDMIKITWTMPESLLMWPGR